MVVGAGAVGLATAYYLQKAGTAVTLVESGSAGRGTSWGNGGWLSPVLTVPTPAPGIPRMGIVESFQRDSAVAVRPHTSPTMIPWLLRFARNCTRSAYRSGAHQLATLAKGMFDGFDELSDIGVPIDVRHRGNLRACLTEAEARHQLAELAPMRATGYPVPETTLRKGEIHELEPQLADSVESGFQLPGERHVDPRQLCDALTDLLIERGAQVLSDTRATGIRVAGGRVTSIETTGEPVTAHAYVVAAGLESRQLVRDLGARLPLRAGKGYSFFVPTEHAPAGPLYLSHTKVGVTPLAGGYRVVGALEIADETLRVDRRVVNSMVAITRRYLREGPPQDASLSQLWAGLRPMTPDGLPLIGRVPHLGNAYVNTGHGMHGVGLSMVSGSALAEFVMTDRRPELITPFTLSRF